MCLITQSCPTLCDPMDCSLPGSSVHGHSPGKNTGAVCHALLQGIFTTEGIEPRCPTLQADSLVSETPGKRCKINSENNLTMCPIMLGCSCLVAKLCLTPCDPMECSLPSSSVHEDFPGKNISELPCPFPGHLLTQGSNPWLLHWQEDS